jgi:hypothetical protein
MDIEEEHYSIWWYVIHGIGFAIGIAGTFVLGGIIGDMLFQWLVRLFGF